jgi:hypothetical protein
MLDRQVGEDSSSLIAPRLGSSEGKALQESCGAPVVRVEVDKGSLSEPVQLAIVPGNQATSQMIFDQCRNRIFRALIWPRHFLGGRSRVGLRSGFQKLQWSCQPLVLFGTLKPTTEKPHSNELLLVPAANLSLNGPIDPGAG